MLTYGQVVGSGAGGGPLASRLARAGQSVLLIESGDDQGTNYNYTVPGYQAAVTQDKSIAWDIYVNHYQDQTRARRDPKYVEGKGILYPRAGTLGKSFCHFRDLPLTMVLLEVAVFPTMH